MAGPNRATLLTQTHKVLKKRYKPVKPDANRPVLEHMIYGLLLENASYADADKAFATLQEAFVDWNDVRAATASELAELLSRLPDPMTTAKHLRRLLRCVFESRYSFELEYLQKENLGKAAKTISSWDGARPFMVSYMVQSALGGHSIPLDRGALDALAVLDVITPAERESGTVPGLERTIAKNKGIEFGSLLHQLSADFVANPYAATLHKTLLKINPGAKDRLPKRPRKSAATESRGKSASRAAASKDGPARKKAKKASRPKARATSTTRRQTAGRAKKPASSRITKRKPR